MTAKAESAPAESWSRRFHVQGITRPVWILSLVSFFADFSSEMVYPIIPLFITGTLGAPALAVGVVEGVAEGTANITKLMSEGDRLRALIATPSSMPRGQAGRWA